jgi:hypothetical protein
LLHPAGLRRHLHQGPQGQQFRSRGPGVVGRAGDRDGGRRQGPPRRGLHGGDLDQGRSHQLGRDRANHAVGRWRRRRSSHRWTADDRPRASGFAPEAFRPGTQWVVQVRNADAWVPNHPLPVVGNTVRISIPAGDDVDGGDPKVVSLDALRARAERWSPASTAGRRLPPEPQHPGVPEAPPRAPTVSRDG